VSQVDGVESMGFMANEAHPADRNLEDSYKISVAMTIYLDDDDF
jgi:hypothetical protein